VVEYESMKILVFSDIHNKTGILVKLVNKINPDYIFFLGDGVDVVLDELGSTYEEKLFTVKGNSDILVKIPLTKQIVLENTKFFLTHGHKYNVKRSLVELYELAREENVNVVCFGHTHRAFCEYINDILFFNPGTIGSIRSEENTYGILEINDQKITQKIEKF